MELLKVDISNLSMFTLGWLVASCFLLLTFYANGTHFDGPIEKWTDEQHILNTNNLTYEHNLALANTFIGDKFNNDELHQYPNNIHIPQTRDPCKTNFWP